MCSFVALSSFPMNALFVLNCFFCFGFWFFFFSLSLSLFLSTSELHGLMDGRGERDEGAQIVLLDMDEQLQALCERPDEAVRLATGLQHAWDRCAPGAAPLLMPTPAWRRVDDAHAATDPVSAEGSDSEDEDDSDERYAALYDSVRATCEQLRAEERQAACEAEADARRAVDAYCAAKRRHL